MSTKHAGRKLEKDERGKATAHSGTPSPEQSFAPFDIFAKLAADKFSCPFAKISIILDECRWTEVKCDLSDKSAQHNTPFAIR